jgi:hypothetical protein
MPRVARTLPLASGGSESKINFSDMASVRVSAFGKNPTYVIQMNDIHSVDYIPTLS